MQDVWWGVAQLKIDVHVGYLVIEVLYNTIMLVLFLQLLLRYLLLLYLLLLSFFI